MVEEDLVSDRYVRQSKVVSQGNLGKSHATIVGVGGLGTVVSTYLALAGVGKLTLVDRDVIEVSNLNRQILYGPSDVGGRKVSVAEERIKVLNPLIKVKSFDGDVGALSLADDVGDVVVSCSDNWTARKHANKLAVDCGVPLVDAGVGPWEGYVSVTLGKPCLSCILPSIRGEFELQSEISKGPKPVLGPWPGFLGSWQANLVLKCLSEGFFDPGFWLADLRDGFMKKMNLPEGKSCIVCNP